MKNKNATADPLDHLFQGNESKKREDVEKEMKSTRYLEVGTSLKLLFTETSILKL